MFLILIVSIFSVLGCQKEDDEVLKLKVAEVTHSAFYAPLYVAIEKGYFEEENIEVELILTPGADKVSAAVLSNDVQIGFAGPESSIYVYNGGENDYLVTFAGLTKRDGQFIVSREKIENFEMTDLIGKEVLGGRVGGMPLLNFQKALSNSRIDENKVDINTSIEFAGLSGAFIGGEGDFVNLFEPNATKLEQEGYGYVVASIGVHADEVPYTAFYTRKSYLESNTEVIKGFTNAIAKGLTYTHENDAETIAKTIIDLFPDTSLNTLVTVVDRYKKADSWKETPFIDEKSFLNLQDIMISSGQIEKYVPYDNLVQNAYN